MEDNKDMGAVALSLPNNQKPNPYNNIKYGSTPLLHPTNKAAKVTPAKEVMRATLEGK